ncbi:MAG: hypothetical protein KBE23_12995 [Chloroflexi bacterium]|nr:hypothetical protein [Chloroflexota bacterium]MBP7043656.1 hypothetical protein [Chloroflexota bacterium]
MMDRRKLFTEVLATLFENKFNPNTINFACSQCRLASRQHVSISSTQIVCPNCAHPMHNMGIGFVVPKLTDNQQWQKIELLVQHDFSFELLPA